VSSRPSLGAGRGLTRAFGSFSSTVATGGCLMTGFAGGGCLTVLVTGFVSSLPSAIDVSLPALPLRYRYRRRGGIRCRRRDDRMLVGVRLVVWNDGRAVLSAFCASITYASAPPPPSSTSTSNTQPNTPRALLLRLGAGESTTVESRSATPPRRVVRHRTAHVRGERFVVRRSARRRRRALPR